MALTAYVAGVPTSGIEYISAAVNESFGSCSVEELGRDQLRYKVRGAVSNQGIVLVVLDTDSMEACKTIESGLFSTERFIHYTDNKSLVDKLNSLYELELEYVVEDVSIESLQDTTEFDSQKMDELIEKYSSQLADKDSIITNLTYRLKEMTALAEEGGYSIDSSEVELIKDENLQLKSHITDLEKDIRDKDTVSRSKDEQIATLNAAVESATAKLETAVSSLNKANSDLSEERVRYSRQAAVIKDKEREIASLTARIATLSSAEAAVEAYKSQVEGLEASVRDLNGEVNNLTMDIKRRDDTISRLESEALVSGASSDQLAACQALLKKAEESAADFERKFTNSEIRNSSLVSSNEELKSKLQEKSGESLDWKKKYEDSDRGLSQANSKIVELNERIRVLSSAVGNDAGTEDIMAEITSLRKKLAIMQSNVFNILSSKAIPRTSVKVPMFVSSSTKYENLLFQFSGSVESRKGTYKCLYTELAKSKDNYIIVDVTSETAVDYVFQMTSNMIDGLPWFSKGGGIQQYLSSTCLHNVKVLMPRIGYINDGFFLSIDWDARLKELNSSGYKVILYCGDISSMVSRVLFEAFSEVGYTRVYVQGNVLGSRAILLHANGLSGLKNCKIGYFSFDRGNARFYEIMAKKYNCEVLSYTGN